MEHWGGKSQKYIEKVAKTGREGPAKQVWRDNGAGSRAETEKHWNILLIRKAAEHGLVS